MIAKIINALENSVAWAVNCELTFGQSASLIGYIKELHADIDRLNAEVTRLTERCKQKSSDCDEWRLSCKKVEIAYSDLQSEVARLERELAGYVEVTPTCQPSSEMQSDLLTDGFGSYYPATCSKCGSPMQVIRPGDVRCSAECYTIDDRIKETEESEIAKLKSESELMAEAFTDIVQLSYDYNGYTTSENLKELIDILRTIAENREPLSDGKLQSPKEAE